MSGLSATETSDEISASIDNAPVRTKSKLPRPLWAVLVVAVVAVLVGVGWAFTYNPLAQTWQNINGEFYTHVENTNGKEAHYTFSSIPDSPVSEQVWSEPSGTFSVEVETEITNTGSHAVRIDQVDKPDFGYKTSGYRVSFYKNSPTGSVAGTPFHPFTLAGHAQKMVVVDYSQRCVTSGTAGTEIFGLSGLPVTYSFFGFSHTVDVPVMPFVFVARQVC
jgi:hypothetical protein